MARPTSWPGHPASISANSTWSTSQNSALGGAMQGLVSAEGAALQGQNTAQKNWSTGIGQAYKSAAHSGQLFHVVASPFGAGANPIQALYDTLASGGKVDQDTLATFQQGFGANSNSGGGTGTGTTTPANDPTFTSVVGTIDGALDLANSTTEDDRVAAVTGVRDGLDSDLATADGEWGTAMTGAGTALGSALDGIADFDWQHVRTFVGAVTGARKAAELGALTAQVGFMSSYYGSMNSYTASLATATVTHATAYAQATADYYVSNADAAATAAEADLTAAISNGASASEISSLTATATAKRAKANAFVTFATSYVADAQGAAQAAATTSVASVASANAAELAEITTDVATATTDINTYYTQRLANAQTAPPAPIIDANNDGIPDPPQPTATASILGNINTAIAGNTTSRTATTNSLNSQATRRPTSTTITFQQTANQGGGTGGTGTGGTSTGGTGTGSTGNSSTGGTNGTSNNNGGATTYADQGAPPANPPPAGQGGQSNPPVNNPGGPEPIFILDINKRVTAQQPGETGEIPLLGYEPLDIDWSGYADRWEESVRSQRHAERDALTKLFFEDPAKWALITSAQDAYEESLARKIADRESELRIVSAVTSRILPALQTAFGAVEATVGGFMVASGTIVTVVIPPAGVIAVPEAALGVALVANGLDVFWDGLWDFWDPAAGHETVGSQIARKFGPGGEAAYEIGQVYLGVNTPSGPSSSGSGTIDDVLKQVDEVAPNSNSPYTLFNKTHSGSQPVPKGVGPNGGRLQSHHGLQQKWASNNIPGYDLKLAPTVTIETGKAFPHTTLSNLQNARRDVRAALGLGKWSSSIDDELGFIVKDFRQAGFGDDVVRQVLEQNYRMLDKLGITYTKPSGF